MNLLNQDLVEVDPDIAMGDSALQRQFVLPQRM